MGRGLRTENRASEVRNGELLFNKYRVPVWDNKEVLEIESGNVLNTT